MHTHVCLFVSEHVDEFQLVEQASIVRLRADGCLWLRCQHGYPDGMWTPWWYSS